MTVTLTPNPASPGSTVTVEGAGFTPKLKTRIKDAGDVWRSRADGGFSVGLVVSTTPRTQTVVVQQQVSGAWITSWSGTVVVQTAAPPPPPAASGTVYGAAVTMDGIGNTQIGGPNGSPSRRVAMRFRALSDRLAWVQIGFPNFNPGYCGGTGGSLAIAIFGDDGSAAHVPETDTPLATVNLANLQGSYGNPPGGKNWPRLAFPNVPTVAGGLYHLVLWNTDPDPFTNFVSLESIHTSGVSGQVTPAWPNTDWAVLYSDGGSWTSRTPQSNGEAYVPMFAHGYADGQAAGLGYVYRGTSLTIGTVRELFTPKVDQRIVSINVRASRSGSGLLGAKITDASGIVSSASLSPGANRWNGASVAPVTLRAGQAYALDLSAPSGTTFSLYALYDGSYGSAGWDPRTYFSDGNVLSGQDIPFYFGLA